MLKKILSFLTLFSFISTAFASDDWESNVQIDTTQIQVNTQYSGGGTQADLKFVVENGNYCKVGIDYDDHISTQFDFRIKFESLVELSDTNDVLNTYDIAEHPLTAFETSVSPISGVSVYKTRTDDNNVEFVFYVSANDENLIDGYTPNSIKIGINIINPFVNTSNYLGLVAKLYTKSSDEIQETEESEEETDGYTTDEKQITVGGDGWFTWKDTVIADGNSTSVIKLTLGIDPSDTDKTDDEESTRIIYKFDTLFPQNIEWDPKIGISRSILAISDGTSIFTKRYIPFIVALLVPALV